MTEIEGAMAEFRGAIAELKAELAEFRTPKSELQGASLQFRTASAELKAATTIFPSQTITAICADFGYFAGVEAVLAALVC